MISIKNTNVRRLFDVYNSQIQNKNWYTVKRQSEWVKVNTFNFVSNNVVIETKKNKIQNVE